MAEVIERPAESTTTKEPTLARGRSQRESIAITLQELGFYDRVPRIREDSRAYLKSTRERLLAERPTPKLTREQVLAQREQFRSHAKGAAQLIEPAKFTLATFDPQDVPYSGSKLLAAQDEIQYGSAAITGDGLGVSTRVILDIALLGLLGLGALPGLIADPLVSVFNAAWSFSFIPPQDGTFRFSAGLLGWGDYTLISDDGWLDSHEVQIQLNGYLGNKSSTLFMRTGANIDEKDAFLGGDRLVVDAVLQGGAQFDFDAGLIAMAAARGDDTFAQMDMTQPVGGLTCTGLTVEQIA